ncbi:MAG: hypothetical protein ACYC18_05675 [Gammaproteobacteria bacterium]
MHFTGARCQCLARACIACRVRDTVWATEMHFEIGSSWNHGRGTPYWC